jgi:hypothetical protein
MVVGVDPLAARDRAANPLQGALDFDAAPRTQPSPLELRACPG